MGGSSCRIAYTELIFPEGNIENPVKLVFYTSVAAN